ncbi:alpha-ribazole phosphatase family protein [Accumulibacter sp.]|uniref:alpha-ribazole phosphatase family protein n=1 Tax=Accumulibacter sp. TaxID=2053492 RepID=UPI0025F4AFC0|nr:alpha-ribazole phosphatase family protein [Accumulibacter sp.]MCM8596708.1 alpha-ribazole phosphatase family protein [Accumulibacter sp.]MCM8624758.1 alpha-ribazole phosphatase family protein [Accumulibacter sp.]MDS4050856.1 alpha-ribazole phosphatase family protein [Accumulibacter sp.]
MQLFLIRHPRPVGLAGICYGRLDVAAEDPQAAAERLRPLIPPATPLLASPLRRARELARALHAQAVLDDRLREIDFGEWEGRSWESIDRREIDAWAADVLHFVPPGGESVAMLQQRVIDCLVGLAGPRFGLVTHAGPIRAALGYWLHWPIGEWSQVVIDYGSVTLLDIDPSTERPGRRPGRATLHFLNR